MWDLTLAHTGAFGLFFPSPLSLGALPAKQGLLQVLCLVCQACADIGDNFGLLSWL